MLPCLRREVRKMSLMKRIGRVGLQKRYFKYDGRPQTELAPEGTTIYDVIDKEKSLEQEPF
jgi:hypothetical protein